MLARAPGGVVSLRLFEGGVCVRGGRFERMEGAWLERNSAVTNCGAGEEGASPFGSVGSLHLLRQMNASLIKAGLVIK
jgi:hypothetical protein